VNPDTVIAALRMALLSVVNAQQADSLGTGGFIRNSAQLRTVANVPPAVKLDLSTTQSGWSVKASNRELKALTCVVWGGDLPQSKWPRTRTDRRVPLKPNVIACDWE
jgi:hypothetical protein